MYFINGSDAGSAYSYTYVGGNVGLEGSIGSSKFYSVYVDKQDLSAFNAKGYAGKSSGVSFGVGVWGSSESWGNRSGVGELWKGQKSPTTWVTTSTGVGFGADLGAKIFWSNYSVWKKLF